MKLLYRYIFNKCLINTGLLLFAFAIIYSIVQALQELGELGKGNYNASAMVIYLAALLPSYIYLLIPLSVLIGVMTAMLSLVKTSEYAIMRTSGVSLKNITRILTIFGILFALITFAIGELIAPASSHFAKVYKLNKTDAHVSSELSSGIWSKDGTQNIINIKNLNQNNNHIIENVQIFSYNKQYQLTQYIKAKSGTFESSPRAWKLNDVWLYSYQNTQIKQQKLNSFLWRSSIDPSYFNVLIIAPEEMPALSLIRYIKHLKQNHQATNRDEVAMWSKLLYPIACISMAFIAIGFIPNSGRNLNLSAKLFIGILIGVAFFFTNKLIGFMAVLYDWNPILAATIPTLALFLCGGWIISHKEV